MTNVSVSLSGLAESQSRCTFGHEMVASMSLEHFSKFCSWV